jgi:hypothetical protein
MSVRISLLAVAFAACESSPASPAAPDTTTDTKSGDTPAADGSPTGDAPVGSGKDGAEAGGCAPTVITVSPPANEDPACKLTADIAGQVYFVDTLVVNEPDNDLITGSLNPLWKQDIKEHKLIILFRVVALDQAARTGQAEVGSGKLEAGTYSWYAAPALIELETKGCHFESAATAEFTLHAATLNKPVVLTNFALSGQFAGDGTAVPTAAMRGAIRKQDAEGLEIDLGGAKLELVSTFELAGVELNADTDGDCTNDAWVLGGDLTAQAITNVALE